MDGTVSKRYIQNSRLRLEYAYLLFNEFKINRINLEKIQKLNFDVVFSDKVVVMTHREQAEKKSAKQF